LCLWQAPPVFGVPTGQGAILDWPAGGTTVTQQDQIRTGCSGNGTLLQRCLKRALDVGTAAQLAGADKIQGALNRGGIGRDWGGLERLNLVVEQQQVEAIGRVQGAQKRF